MNWMWIVAGAVLVTILVMFVRRSRRRGQIGASGIGLDEAAALDASAETRARAILDANLATFADAEAVGAMLGIPGLALIPSPTWRRLRGRIQRSLTLVPTPLRDSYYAADVQEALKRSLRLVAEVVRNAHVLEEELQDLVEAFEGDWGEAPTINDGRPYQEGDRILSLVLADVARCLSVHATKEEIRARYQIVDDEGLRASLASKLGDLVAKELSGYMDVLGGGEAADDGYGDAYRH